MSHALQLADLPSWARHGRACSASSGRACGSQYRCERSKASQESGKRMAGSRKTIFLEYRGFVEGEQIGQGIVDVVVVEGMRAIALKTARPAKQCSLRARGSEQLGGPNGALMQDVACVRAGAHGPGVNGDQPGLNGIVIKTTGVRRIRLASAQRRRLRHGAKRPVGASRSRLGIATRQTR